MDRKISVVINTLNEEKNIAKAIGSADWADEIIVCDMYSDDNTVEIAKKLGAKVVRHKRTNYVEPARNFTISKTVYDWILILDADEEIPKSLSEKLIKFVKKPISSNFIEIPRKNIIFGKWIKASGWWPDHQVRFFKKGKVLWNDKIHGKPKVEGLGLKLATKEEWAIVHHNYQTISQFIERMNRYTNIEAKQLKDQGYKFEWTDLIRKPLNEFLSRFFVQQGYKDGLHGFVLSILQAFSFLLVYLKTWEMDRFKESTIDLDELEQETEKASKAFNFWARQYKLSRNPFKKLLQKIKSGV